MLGNGIDFVYGLEVQAPWAGKVLDGEKKIETRGYALPEELEGRWVFMLESKKGGGQLTQDWRITGAVLFGKVSHRDDDHIIDRQHSFGSSLTLCF